MQTPEPLQKALLDWYVRARRSLPWREHPSLYGTVVSEFMLQQTQVSTVLPYYARWLERFPDFATLAQATEADVLKLWEGLGYYSRARNLQRLAQALEADGVPNSHAAWLALPGVGPYTAAAIASIAEGLPHAVVDGNVVRVLARVHAIATPFGGNAAAVKAIAPLADALLSKENPGDFNQALMELGATLCTKANPQCGCCPWQAFCRAAASENPTAYPRIQRRATVQKAVDRIWVVNDNKLLLRRIPTDAVRLAGHYELPMTADCRQFVQLCREPLMVKKRGIANESIRESIYSAELINTAYKVMQALEDGSRFTWVGLEQLDSVQLSGPHRRWIREILLARAKKLVQQ